MNAAVQISMWEGDDGEKANIRIRDLGSITELRFSSSTLSGVAVLTSLDIMRILEAIKLAESKRIDPDQKTIACLEHVIDRIDYMDDEKSRLHVTIEAEMPIASCGSVLLAPNLKATESDMTGSDEGSKL